MEILRRKLKKLAFPSEKRINHTSSHSILKEAGAPNESILQNHLNIALLNVYLNGRYMHVFIP